MEFPWFSSEIFDVVNPPMATFPKLRLAGLADNRRVAATALPVRGITTLELVPLTDSVSVPLNVPVLVGENVTLKFDVPPAAKVSGTVSPDVPNPAPWVASPEINALEVVVFLS